MGELAVTSEKSNAMMSCVRQRFAAMTMAALCIATLVGRAKQTTFQPVRLAIEAPGFGASGANALLLKRAETGRQIFGPATDNAGAVRDITSKAQFEVSPAGIVRVEKSGLLIPVADGEATLQVKHPNGLTARLLVHVRDAKTETAVNFPNQIVPIFTKGGCNAGGCHGKSSGQNGFKLS